MILCIKVVGDQRVRTFSLRLLRFGISLASCCRLCLDVHVSAIVSFLAAILVFEELADLGMVVVAVLAFVAIDAAGFGEWGHCTLAWIAQKGHIVDIYTISLTTRADTADIVFCYKNMEKLG